ncbi:PREDICTED: GATA zinc finger domain-containing protein 10-like [Eufriesea mexicana]|uniref:GATA zinc finger domain-containing protein 10-like n=1 Tax=Eufriesea mexicana TaxID=516756 RepID=UPI00083C81DD|nr:PREDICTED: GATA zinc finger domain-containing protein 10-like [Eufriesea mexicana]
MNKRKASVERNTKQKASSRRPSNTSVNTRTNVGQQKVRKPEKLPSANNINAQGDSSKPTNKAVDVCMPKTRFSSQDRSRDSRSCSSPRLKCFPAEKIKKLDSPPPFSPKPIGALIAQQDPRESGVLYVSTPLEQRRDNGQGDSAAVTQHLHQRHQQQGVHSASQQQVVPQQAIHQIGQMNPHSKSLLPQQVANVQSHRPFVPHGLPDYSQNSQKNPHATSSNPPRIPTNPGVQQVANNSVAIEDHGKTKNEDQTSDLDYEKQPVGGRNAAVYMRTMVNSHGQTASQIPMDPATSNAPNINLQNAHNRYPSASQVPSHTNPQNPQNPPNPQHIHQQLQQNRLQQRAVNYQMQVMGSQQQPEGSQGAPYNYNSQQGGMYFPGQGMTSPQDAVAGQMKNSRMLGSIQQNYPVHQDDLDYGMNAQNGWSRNNKQAEYSSAKGQLKTYHVDVVNGNQPQYAIQNQPQQQFIPQNQQQQQFLTQNPQQQQFMPQNPQQQQFIPQTQQRQQFVAQNQQRQQFVPQNQQQRQFVPQNQQQFVPQSQQRQQFVPQNQQQQFMPHNPQQQLFVPQNQQQQFIPQQGTAMPQRQQNSMAYNQAGLNQQPPDGNSQPQMGRKKPMKFTVGMVRDQEKLLATMKQQGVPMDVMKRQFDLLLNEQRRHLEYLELIQQQKDSQEERRTEVTIRRRKQQDEKPDWMIHLTPPRLSYLEIEKLQEQQRKEREVKELEAMQQQQQQTQQQMTTTREIPGHQVPVQATNQQNYQLWQQQQQRVPQHYNNAYVQPPVVSGPGVNGSEPMKSMIHHQNATQYQYAHAQPHPNYNPQLQYQQFYQTAPQQNPQQNQQQLQSANNLPVYEGSRSPNEPSSLLKMRRYKNEVRPQRQNNGLQDPEVAKKHLEDFKVSTDARKGLEYLANLAPKKRIVRLNGIQDRNELEAEFQQRMITSTFQPAAKVMSANGLENNRNPDNPLPQRLSNLKKSEQEFLKEYPRQKQNNPRNCYSVPAERENGSVAMGHSQLHPQQTSLGQVSTSLTPYSEKNQMINHGGAMPYRFDGSFPQHYQQMHQYYQNSRNLARNNGEGDVGSTQRIEQSKRSFDHAGGDASENMNRAMNGQMAEGKIPYQGVYYNQPSINEPRTIGGVRYLARKQDYLPNQQILAPETLIANRHVQPPVMY